LVRHLAGKPLIFCHLSVSNPDALAAYAKLSGGIQQRTVVTEFNSVEQAKPAHDTQITKSLASRAGQRS
jgi:hypothetical protein